MNDIIRCASGFFIALGLVLHSGLCRAEVSPGEDLAIALVNKVSSQVHVRRSDREELVPLQVEDKLFPGDRIICGERGYASIMFIDTAAELKLFPNSDITLQGKRDAEGIVKRIFLPVGKLLTKVLKGKAEVVTPTAVASVKGTKWWTLVESADETQVIVLEGEVQVQHRATEEMVLVNHGHTGISSSDGALSVVLTREENIPDESIERESGKIEIEFEDESGEKKTIQVEFDK